MTALFAAAALSVVADEPKEYWYIGSGDFLGHNDPEHDSDCLWVEDCGSVVHKWESGNIAVFAAADNKFWPAVLQGKQNTSFSGQVAIYGGQVLDAYGIVHSASRSIYGSGRVNLGAGGYVQRQCWGTCAFSLQGGFHFAASQTWELQDSSISIDSTTPTTCVEGFEWTIQTADVCNEDSHVTLFGDKNLAGSTVTVTRKAHFALAGANAAIHADKLILDGSLTRLVVSNGFPHCIGPAIAKELYLRNGASPVLTERSGAHSSTGYQKAVPLVTYDLDKLVVESGVTMLGQYVYNGLPQGFAPYAIADEGMLTVEVRAGATLNIAAAPTAGKLHIIGAGNVMNMTGAATGIEYDANFTGEVVEPQKYWYAGTKNLVGGNDYLLESDEGAEKHPWVDGNILVVKNPSESYWPAVLQGKHAGSTDTVYVNKNMFLYGLEFTSGARTMNDTGHIDLGAGGYKNTGSWDYHQLNLWGGLRLCASQTWVVEAGVDVYRTCALTALDDVVWTITTVGNTIDSPGQTVSASRGGGVYIKGPYDLSNADIVISNAGRIYFTAADSALNARSLTLDGPHAIIATSEFDPEAPLRIDRAYSPNVTLKNGASLALFRVVYNSPALKPVDNVVYDFDKVTIESGETVLGHGIYGTTDYGAYAYSIKEVGTLDIEVKAGATLKLYSYPTAGRLRISGKGTIVDMTGAMPDVDFNNFSGTIALSGLIRSIDDLAAFAGGASLTLIDSYVNVKSVAGYTGTLTATGKSRLALPKTTDWPATLTVTTADNATLYLTYGEPVDETKLGGTKNYKANAIGQTPVTGTFTVNYGENYAICGDGFGEGATLALNSGCVDIPVPSTVAADVTVLQLDASKRPCLRALESIECEFSGAWTINGPLSISNTVYNSSAKRQRGRTIFTGPGLVQGGALYVASCIEFRGPAAQWTFNAATSIDVNDGDSSFGARDLTIDITEGASLDFVDGVSALSMAVRLGSTANSHPIFKVATNSTVRVGNNRVFIVGDSAWQHQSKVWVCGGTLAFEGNYGGIYDNGAHDAVTGTGNDRCPFVTYLVTDGGVLKTDRVISTGPVVFGLFANEGLHITLDGGTYKLGENFGCNPDLAHPLKGCNHLIGGTTGGDGSYSNELDYQPYVKFTIGANGGTFDLSAANPRNNSFTNAPLGKLVPCSKQAQKDKWGEYIPSTGPVWDLQGELKVKGNGNQEFVINGLDAADLTSVTADGAAIKIVSDSEAMDFETLSLGAHGGSLAIIGENNSLTVPTLNVLENGAFDASLFGDEVIFNDAVFGANSALWVRKVDDTVKVAYFFGMVTLPQAMRYFGDRGIDYGTKVFDGMIDAPEMFWTRVGKESARYSVEVQGTAIYFNEPEPLPLMLLLK